MENSKLVQFIEEIKKSVNNGLDGDIFSIQLLMQYLKNNPDVLKQFDEFKDVKHINFVDTPMFSVHVDTEEPVKSDGSYLGGPTKPIIVQTVSLGNRVDLLNEVVDIYTIDTVETYNPEYVRDLPCGVWQFPTVYNPEDFSAIKKIEIKYSLTNISDNKEMSFEDAKKHAKDVILKEVARLIDSQEINVFKPKTIMLRCSPRSIKKQDN